MVFVHDLRCYYGGRTEPRAAEGKSYTPAGDGKGWILDRTAGSLVPAGHWFSSPSEWWSRRLTSEKLQKAKVIGFYGCTAERVAELGKRCMSARQPAVLFLDEIDKLPPVFRERSALFDVLNHGRRTPIDVFGSCRRPEHVDKSLFTETNVGLLFSLLLESSRVAMVKSGWPGAQQWAPRLAELKPREHYRIEVGPDIL